MMIDSNIIIYAVNPASHKHAVAKEFLRSQSTITIAQQNVFETLRIITHTQFPQPLSPKEAVVVVRKIIAQSDFISPLPQTVDLAFELIQKHHITGTEIFDAYLVATALSNDIHEIATDNVKHLGKYTEINILNPFV